MRKNYKKFPKVLAIIPARGGSKRLPGKNIKLLAGKPLIAYAITAARKSKLVNKVVVSTDDLKIASIAKKYKAEVPFLRPASLATDRAKVIDVLLHAINFFEKQKHEHFDIIVLIQPTAPLIETQDIDQVITTLIKNKTKSCVSVCEVSERPEWMYKLAKNRAKPINPAINLETRSQDFPLYYRLNGAVYAIWREVILHDKKIINNDSLSLVIMPKERSIDIDEMIDFKIAQALIKYHDKKN